jgi:predicted HicB family RNase H-like nuclease
MNQDVLDILATKYQRPHWVFMREFRDATGFDAKRSADALAVGLYSSRGQHIIGFEVKTFRSDWLRELKRPEKADPIARFCDFFNLVVPELSIVNIGELPAPWGLIVVDQAKGKVHIAKKAEQLQAQPITRSFMCAIVKQTMDLAQMPTEKALHEALEAGKQHGRESAKQNESYELRDLRKLKEVADAFTKESGVELSAWEDGKRIGEAVAVVTRLMRGDYTIFQHLQEGREALDRALQELRALVPQKAQEVAA